MDEIDAIKSINDALSQIGDETTRNRVLRWAWEKFASEPVPVKDAGELRESKPRESKKGTAKKKTPKSKSTPTIVKNLNLKPKGQTSFKEFADSKHPTSNAEKCVVAIFYLQHETKRGQIGTNDVFTCFKHMNWRVPSDLENTLQWSASQKGWLDTSSMTDIKLTTHAENLIEHDLPKKSK